MNSHFNLTVFRTFALLHYAIELCASVELLWKKKEAASQLNNFIN